MKFNRNGVTGGMLGGIALFASMSAQAMNYFELETYPYNTAARGEVEVENRMTYSRRGTKEEETPGANKGLTRSSFEAVYGVTDKSEVAAYVDYARPRDGEFDRVANRVRYRTRFYEKGELPVDLGLYAEMEFPRRDVNDAEFELRGILEKDFDKWTFDFNPMFEKVVRGIEAGAGWEFQYAASLIYRMNERWHPRLDLFGDFGLIRNFDSKDQQKQLLSPAVDIKFGHGLFAGFGIGYGLTKATEQQVVRARIEWEFY
jgi:hypothetical protein